MITEYLDSKLTRLPDMLKEARLNSHSINFLRVEDEICKKLTSKKFRKWSLDDATKKHIAIAVRENISQGKPLQVVYPFGGYKLWQLPSSPKIDWAEFLSVVYYIEYLIPLVVLYEPGVELVFTSDDFILERMNNISKQNTDLYHESFVNLTRLIQRYLPHNLTIKLARTSEFYNDQKMLETELSLGLLDAKDYYNSLKVEQLNYDIEIAKKNIQWQGARDLTSLRETEIREYAFDSLVYHGAYTHLAKRLDYNRGTDKVIINASPATLAIPLGTTKRSVVKFWVGVGLLEIDDDRINAKVASLRQLEVIGYKKISTRNTIVSNSLTNDNFDNIFVQDVD